MQRSATRLLLLIGALALAALPSFVNTVSATDDLCERLHTEYLTKAQERSPKTRSRKLFAICSKPKRSLKNAQSPHLKDRSRRIRATKSARRRRNTASVDSPAESDIELFGTDRLSRLQPLYDLRDFGLSHKPKRFGRTRQSFSLGLALG